MFGTMKLSVKLYSGFLVVLVLLAILGATGFLAIESASDGFSDYRRKARVRPTSSAACKPTCSWSACL
jgi:CHASE3 domain sensor protein